MSNHIAVFEARGSALALQSAILLYGPEGSMADRSAQGRTDSAAFASIHPIEDVERGRPTIGAGTPLTRAHLRQWANALNRTTRPELLPPNVLVAHADMLVWWVPAEVRSGMFALTSTKGLNSLAERTTVPVPYPAHVFVATRSRLKVYALAKSERPTADTALLHSPILNVYANGDLCWGSIPRPKAMTVASMPDFERAVFQSWSTHPNPGQDQTVTGRSGLAKLWDDIVTRQTKTFPVKRLKPVGFNARQPTTITLGNLIASGASK